MDNQTIVKKYFEEIWNNRDESVAREIVADSLITRFPQKSRLQWGINVGDQR